MTPEEILDENVRNAIRAHSRECWKCHGEKVAVSFDDEPQTFTLADGSKVTGRKHGPCSSCNGTGVIVPDIYAATIQCAAYSAMLGMVIRARHDEDFDTLNRALDWGWAYVTRMAQIAFSEEGASEELAGLLERMKDSPLDKLLHENGSVAPAGGLSAEELRELGVLDESDGPD